MLNRFKGSITFGMLIDVTKHGLLMFRCFDMADGGMLAITEVVLGVE
jgi:hypothetical protein